jgi:hypothetical protein
MAPARFNIVTIASSSAATLSANSTLPTLVGSPLASIRFLTPSGSPCSGPEVVAAHHGSFALPRRLARCIERARDDRSHPRSMEQVP